MSTRYYYSKKNDFTQVKRNENNEVSLNTQLLLQLYVIQSPSGHEDHMASFIKSYIKKNHKGVSVRSDEFGNVLVTKGSLRNTEHYPCLVAHMDEVHDYSANRMIIKADEFVFGFDTKTGERAGTGADDKNGILVALEMLNHFDKLKLVFSVGEEICCVGSGKVNLEFFNDIAYMLQCDRRGNTNLITKTNGVEVMNDEMIYEILDICSEYGYSEETGTSTDVGCLLKRGIGVSGCNISCGYFGEHTDNELTHLPSLDNCMTLVYYFIIQS